MKNIEEAADNSQAEISSRPITGAKHNVLLSGYHAWLLLNSILSSSTSSFNEPSSFDKLA